ncbi:MAG TPA: translocation/assembly module TamB domain-containing protein, partial [Gemmatimonas sp.]|uniref:translocation/assembly module TamB domain-containing protein n=1 Tax=Gemmatimonas sp. TaxID=1962908 RepID=UPI002ED92712
WVAALLLSLGAGLVTTYWWLTGTEGGRAWLLAKVIESANGVFGGRGTLRIGVLREVSRGRIVAEQVALVDTAGVPVVTAERLGASLTWGALLRKAIRVNDLVIDGLVMDLRQDTPGTPWNIAHIIAGDTTTKVPSLTPGFGDDVIISSIAVAGAKITTFAPWEPHPMFTGAARDSIIALRDSTSDLTPASGGRWFERRTIELSRLKARDVVVVDARKRPSSLQIDSLSGSISAPPVPIKNAAGRVLWTSDSLMLDLPRVELPASVGSAKGTVAWNQPGAVRYDVQVKADAGLSDLNWVWDVLPMEGRGQADVRLRTLENPDDTEYALTNLDVQTGGSRIRGGIAITVRPADLLLHKVDLAFAPLRSDLLRRISYDAVPETVKGSITGRLVAAEGGPLSALKLDLLEARFVDEAVASGGQGSAVSTVTLRGTVGIGAEPRATNMAVSNLRVDLRSLKPFMPDSLTVDGLLTGTLSLRSADMARADVPQLALVWTDAASNVSSVRGRLTARYDRDDIEVNTNLALEPLSMRAIARIDTMIPIQSRLAGRVALDGKLSALNWRAELAALSDEEAVRAVGEFASANARADSARTDSTGTLTGEGAQGTWARSVALSGTASVGKRSWRATADGSLFSVDARRWYGRTDMPATAISGNFHLTGQGPLDTLAAPVAADSGDVRVLSGRAVVQLQQAQAEGQPSFDLVASALLDPQRLVVDSALAHLGGITFDARGGLSRDSLQSDTLQVSLRSDSLDAARAELTRLAGMLQPMDSVSAQSLRDVAADTLSGDLSLSGYVVGSFTAAQANMAVGGRALQVGAIKVGRIFGSLRAEDVFRRPTFEGTATFDEVTGIGAVRIQSATARVTEANPDSGRLVLDVGTETDAQLVARGGYGIKDGASTITLDSLRLSYDEISWRSQQPIVVVTDSAGLRMQPAELRSTEGGVLAVDADVPTTGDVRANLRLERFPVGEVATLLAGTAPFDGTLTGSAELRGKREAPLIGWQLTGDSLGVNGYRLPSVVSKGNYADQRLVAEASISDSLGGTLRVSGRIPIDLRMASVEKRLLSDAVEGALVADSLRVQALPIQIDGVSRQRGVLSGQLTLGGTFERPNATGTVTLEGAGASFDQLGIAPYDGRMVVRANADSIVLESLRLRSGRSANDTISAQGVLLMPANDPMRVDVRLAANNFEASRQRDGMDLDVSGNVRVAGPLKRPTVSGNLLVPRANIVVNPLGERVALDLNSEAARELLGADEVPVAESAAQSLSALGSLITVENARVDLGSEVWVQTPEARVKLGGGLTVAMSGDRLALDGEITASRGQYRLALGPVVRSFAVDSGSVRFYPNADIAPTLNINATNNVRVTDRGDVPIKLHISGAYDNPVLTLSSTDPLFAAAPESEIISLLIFGAPTFALDGQRKSTVDAVAGVLIPTIGGAVEGKLQSILPGNFNTVQVSTGNNQSGESVGGIASAVNLSISAGKQIGDRTYLRLNTGVCRGQQAARGNPLWAGIAAEYTIARGWMAQVGVDPGSAPCSQVGSNDAKPPAMQFGFDLFRNWIF